ncbi:MAG: phosphoribosylanthranilate isomerase [Acidobacteria bacterium]|nr:phosphoribosylanthranilate isomerase [Acidobacteriota bacterium]
MSQATSDGPIIKVCGVTTPQDAAMAVEAGATAIGFNFWPRSPRYVQPQTWMKETPALKVGIFVGEAPERVMEIAALAGLDVAQIYGSDAPPMRVWRAVKPGADMLPAEGYVMDVSEGTGQTFDWSLAAGAGDRIVLAGGLDGSNVREAIRVARPWGVDACSRLESSPGKKDAARVQAFVAAAREEFIHG